MLKAVRDFHRVYHPSFDGQPEVRRYEPSEPEYHE
jgi:hypothetical protein